MDKLCSGIRRLARGAAAWTLAAAAGAAAPSGVATGGAAAGGVAAGGVAAGGVAAGGVAAAGVATGGVAAGGGAATGAGGREAAAASAATPRVAPRAVTEAAAPLAATSAAPSSASSAADKLTTAALPPSPATAASATGPARANAAAALRDALADEVRRIALPESSGLPAGSRVEVRVGQLDPRLKLAPCESVEPYLPPNAKAWGRTRIGLRCLRGAVRWNVYLPVTVAVYAPGLVAAAPLAGGSVLAAKDLRIAEIDIAEHDGGFYLDAAALAGRTLARPLAAGEGLRATHLAARRWFAAGEIVRITTVGAGFTVAGSGEALTPGIEGLPARVRTESGRVVSGTPVGDREVQLRL